MSQTTLYRLPCFNIAGRTGRYMRIEGPHVWIEWAAQGRVVFSVPHPHFVWRDKTKDYGGNLTGMKTCYVVNGIDFHYPLFVR